MFGNRRNYFNYGYPGQMMQKTPSNFEDTRGVIRNQPYPDQSPYQSQSPHQSQNPYQSQSPYQNPYQNQNQSQSQSQNHQWQSYQQQNPYYQGGIQPLNPYFQGGYQPLNQAVPQANMQTQHSHIPTTYPHKDSQFLFQNPLQPQEEMHPNQFLQSNGYQNMNQYPNQNMNPYPKQNLMPKHNGGMQSFMNSFKSQDGSVDYNKMMNTAGQMMSAVNQVSSIVKGLGGFFKA
jgi:hypothetical protein